jgi:hypothetical protein
MYIYHLPECWLRYTIPEAEKFSLAFAHTALHHDNVFDRVAECIDDFVGVGFAGTFICEVSVISPNLKLQIGDRITLGRDEDDAVDALIFEFVVKDRVPFFPVAQNVFFHSHGSLIEMGVPNIIVLAENLKPDLTEPDLS